MESTGRFKRGSRSSSYIASFSPSFSAGVELEDLPCSCGIGAPGSLGAPGLPGDAGVDGKPGANGKNGKDAKPGDLLKPDDFCFDCPPGKTLNKYP